tara:strand:- start:2125 stop:3240 length:1116 start_codon:yes stop_codon:yes gene_type:complete
MNDYYDLIVIGAGISACTFASNFNKNFPNSSILLVEHGRRIGGRSTSRKSRNNIIQYDHGLPSITFSNNPPKEIAPMISSLINSKKLIDISNEIFLIDEKCEINQAFLNNKTYRCLPFMMNFCEEIVNQSSNPQNINFLFQTLSKSFRRKNNLWEVEINYKKFVRSKILILSSSLLAHPRCLEILKVNSLPVRDALLEGKDYIVDSLIRKISKQEYIKRRNYILFVSSKSIVKNFKYKYLQVIFSETIKDEFKFEKIIFQIQLDGSMIIILHSAYINKLYKKFESVIPSLMLIFAKQKQFVDLFLEARVIDQMDWRASQPINNFLSQDLQWSSNNNIGFCGDWFDAGKCSRVEAAMTSSIRLSNLLNENYL